MLLQLLLLKPQQVLNHLNHLRRAGLISINWREGTIMRQGTMKDYVLKQATSTSWPDNAKNWRRIRSKLKSRHNQVNPEYDSLLSTKRSLVAVQKTLKRDANF